jgi:hypothetical protein
LRDMYSSLDSNPMTLCCYSNCVICMQHLNPVYEEKYQEIHVSC